MPIKKEDFEFIHLECIDSTNDYAKKLVCKSFEKNAIIISDIQTNGRTTKKENWISPLGNLYLTIMIKLRENEERFFPQFSFLTAISVIDAISEVAGNNFDIKIKWPNDILFNVQKLCGILIEKEGPYAIIGIGLNVESSPDKSLTRYPTTSLFENGIEIDKILLSEKIVSHLIKNINICKVSKFESIIKLVKPLMYKMGEQIFIDVNNKNLSGIFHDIAPNGGLILKTENEIKTFLSAELTKENFI